MEGFPKCSYIIIIQQLLGYNRAGITVLCYMIQQTKVYRKTGTHTCTKVINISMIANKRLNILLTNQWIRHSLLSFQRWPYSLCAVSSDLVSNSKRRGKTLHTGKFIVISWGNNPLKQLLAWFSQDQECWIREGSSVTCVSVA